MMVDIRLESKAGVSEAVLGGGCLLGRSQAPCCASFTHADRTMPRGDARPPALTHNRDTDPDRHVH